MLSLSNAGAEGGPPSAIRLRALSFSAGVQSTTLALVAVHGAVGSMKATIDRDDSPQRRSARATCLPTSRGARAEPRQQPRKLASGTSHSDRCLFSLYRSRASGHRRRGEAGPDHMDARCGNHSALNCAWDRSCFFRSWPHGGKTLNSLCTSAKILQFLTFFV